MTVKRTNGIGGPVLEYHYPDDSQFSLVHVTGDHDRHERYLASRRGDSEYTVRALEEEVDGVMVYLTYGNNAPDEPLPDLDSTEEFSQWLRDRFDADDLPIVLTVFRAYRGVIEEKDAADDELTLYKQMQLGKLPQIMDRVGWGQTVPAVASELLSEFILAHPMPNTNHRTGITLLDRYLTSVADEFTMPETGEEGEWYDWVVDYIYDSKRLLTLRRKTPVFRYAAALGYHTVRRKEGITIDLTAVDLERSDAFDHYSEQHLERTREFIEHLLDEGGATVLREEVDPGKQAFVDRLRADQ